MQFGDFVDSCGFEYIVGIDQACGCEELGSRVFGEWMEIDVSEDFGGKVEKCLKCGQLSILWFCGIRMR